MDIAKPQGPVIRDYGAVMENDEWQEKSGVGWGSHRTSATLTLYPPLIS
jgi:hypothetical protein